MPPTQAELSEEERLHREVFANEKGFLESTVFNPTKAKRQAQEEEVARVSTEWGSTPKRVKEIMDKTAGDEELSFQVLQLWLSAHERASHRFHVEQSALVEEPSFHVL